MVCHQGQHGNVQKSYRPPATSTAIRLLWSVWPEQTVSDICFLRMNARIRHSQVTSLKRDPLRPAPWIPTWGTWRALSVLVGSTTPGVSAFLLVKGARGLRKGLRSSWFSFIFIYCGVVNISQDELKLEATPETHPQTQQPIAGLSTTTSTQKYVGTIMIMVAKMRIETLK